MINKNAVIVLNCIMALNKCDMVSAIKFAEHNQTCYEIARAVANAKDEDFEAEKQALIDKACEFLKSYRQDICDGLGYIAGIVNDETIEDFKKYMES